MFNLAFELVLELNRIIHVIWSLVHLKLSVRWKFGFHERLLCFSTMACIKWSYFSYE